MVLISSTSDDLGARGAIVLHFIISTALGMQGVSEPVPFHFMVGDIIDQMQVLSINSLYVHCIIDPITWYRV